MIQDLLFWLIIIIFSFQPFIGDGLVGVLESVFLAPLGVVVGFL